MNFWTMPFVNISYTLKRSAKRNIMLNNRNVTSSIQLMKTDRSLLKCH
ncbi:MAG: hypothetical protein IJU14_06490 [Clostridia bacterium]|nr:hypothetical protein [Clostridia bacterium]